jgi:hypothetical protein
LTHRAVEQIIKSKFWGKYHMLKKMRAVLLHFIGGPDKVRMKENVDVRDKNKITGASRSPVFSACDLFHGRPRVSVVYISTK